MKSITIAAVSVILGLFVVAMFAVSCEGNPAITYNLEITGHADGNVLIEFPNGRLHLSGNTDIEYLYGNVPIYDSYDMEVCEQSRVRDWRRAAKRVKEDRNKFNVTSVAGKYFVHIQGYAEAYGVKVTIDRTFEN